MKLAEEKALFEKNKIVYESKILQFYGTEGFDVYNTTVPFTFKGKTYLFGRVERRGEWARSWVRLFEQTGENRWAEMYSGIGDCQEGRIVIDDPFAGFRNI